jgi:DnaJ-domain-containing protein 1
MLRSCSYRWRITRQVAGARGDGGAVTVARAPRGAPAVQIVAADFYKALQVSRSATKAEVKTAYRRQLRQCRPDVDSSSEAKAQFQVRRRQAIRVGALMAHSF